MKKNKYYPSKQGNMLKFKSLKKAPIKKDYIILLHKVGVNGYSRSATEEVYHKYKNYLSNSFGNIEIMNIVVLDRSSEKIKIKLLYPDYNNIKNNIYEYLNKFQKRKIEIYDLINNTI